MGAAKPVRVKPAPTSPPPLALLSSRLPVSTPALAAGLVGLGVAGILHGILRHPAPFHALPALHGLMTVGFVGFLLLLLARVDYRASLTAMLPVIAIQVAAALTQRASWAAQVGSELLVFGLVGLALVALARPRAAARQRRTAPRSAAPTAAFN